MISPDILFEGFDAASWTNLLSLFAPGVGERVSRGVDGSDGPSGTLVLVRDHSDHLLAAMHTVKGRLRGFDYRGEEALAEMAKEVSAVRGVLLREGAVEQLTEELAKELSKEDAPSDYLSQWLVLLRAVRRLRQRRFLVTWPQALTSAPVPSDAAVRRVVDAVLPVGKSALMVIWEDQVPWTCVALRRGEDGVDHVVGPDVILRWAGPLGGDWRRDHRVISEAVERMMGEVHLGIFAQRETIERVLRTPDAGSWLSAVTLRDIVVQPTPPYVAVALGADGVRFAASTTSRVLGGINALSLFAPAVRFVRSRVSEIVSVTDSLGFNPLTLLARALQRRDDVMADAEENEVGSDETKTSAGPTSLDGNEG